MLEILLVIAIFVAGVLLTTASQIVLQEPLHHFLVRVFAGGLPRPRRHVKGIWECCYRYPTKDTYEYERQLMRLSQVGPFVMARNVTSQSHKHRLSGMLKSSAYLTGRWENIAEGEIWHGTFQFVLHPTGTSMFGKWLGFDSQGEVQHGPWAWRLLARDTSKSFIDDFLRHWQPDDSLLILCRPPEDDLRNLISKYGAAWEQQDVSALNNLFTEDALYQERAFDRPLRGLSEIQQYWERKVVNQQRNIRFRILSIYGSGNTGVAEWEAEFDDLIQNVRKQIREVALFELSEGKISSLREYWSVKRL